MSREEKESPKTQVNSLLTKLTVSHRISMEKAMCDIGLHSGQVQILMELWQNDALSQADLVRKLNVSPPTINKMVKRLVESGFVKNNSCPHDRRLKRVHITAKGRDIRPKVEIQLQCLEDSILREITETEKLLLPILLTKILDNLQEIEG